MLLLLLLGGREPESRRARAPCAQLLNALCEAMCTTALVYGALMIYARRDQLYGPEKAMFRSIGVRAAGALGVPSRCSMQPPAGRAS